MIPHLRFDFTFPRNYEARILEGAPLPHPLEKLYHYPAELEEGDRTGVYVRVEPRNGNAWNGFFALGFDSEQVVHAIATCPDPDSLCVVAGGYGYVMKAHDPTQWFRLDQSPVVDLRVLQTQKQLLFVGFTTISAVGASGLAWTTEQLSWEGIRIGEISAQKLHGFGWDALRDKEVPFELDLSTGKHSGGSRPGRPN